MPNEIASDESRAAGYQKSHEITRASTLLLIPNRKKSPLYLVAIYIHQAPRNYREMLESSKNTSFLFQSP